MKRCFREKIFSAHAPGAMVGESPALVGAIPKLDRTFTEVKSPASPHGTLAKQVGPDARNVVYEVIGAAIA